MEYVLLNIRCPDCNETIYKFIYNEEFVPYFRLTDAVNGRWSRYGVTLDCTCGKDIIVNLSITEEKKND